MRGRWRICGRLFLKRFATRSHALSAEPRTRSLRRAGINTPEARTRARGTLVCFEKIERHPAKPVPDIHDPLQLSALARLVSQIHHAVPPQDLPHFDPLAKITPRMHGGSDAILAQIARKAVSDIGHPRRRSGIVHGDLHLGQFVLDKSGSIYIVDLDDMAIGHPEADLGNFAAHHATQRGADQTVAAEAMRRALEITLKAYLRAGGRADPVLAEAYGRLALVRRALKLRDDGEPRLACSLQERGVD